MAQQVFNNYELKEYIFSFIYSLEYILENDLVHIFQYHEDNIKFMDNLNDDVFDLAADYQSFNILRWLIYKRKITGTEQALDIAIDKGNFDIINFIHENSKEGCSFDALIYAAEQNNTITISWLIKNYKERFPIYIFEKAMISAIKNSCFDAIVFLYNSIRYNFNRDSLYLSQEMINIAISIGNKKIIKYITDRSKDYSYHEILLAAKYNHYDILVWLYEERFYNIIINKNTAIIGYSELTNFVDELISANKCIVYACKNNNFDIVNYINKKTTNISVKIIKEAINTCSLYNNFDLLKYILNKFNLPHISKIIDDHTIINAIKGKNIILLKYLYNLRYASFPNLKILNKNRSFLEIACKLGNLDLVIWLNHYLYESNPKNVFYFASKFGYLHILNWLLENRKDLNIQCDEKVCDIAAINGHLEIVELLFNLNIYCTSKAIIGAAMNGHIDILEYIKKNNDCPSTYEAMDLAAMNGHLDTIIWLYNNRKEGCSKDAMDLASKNGYLDIVKWLHYNLDIGCTKAAMDNAAERGHLDIVRWLYNNRNEGCSSKAVIMAAIMGHISIVKFLLNKVKVSFDKQLILKTYKLGRFTISNLLNDHLLKS